MGLKLYDETSVQAIANAIRANNGSNNTYTISEMSTAIEKIDKGGTHTETKTVTFLNTTTPFNVGDNFLSGYGVYSQDNSYALAIAVSDGVGFAARLHNGVVDGYSAACTYSNGVFTFDSAFVLNYMGNSVYSLNCLFGNGGIYKYHWSNDGTICAREGVGETKWFFKGYVTNNGQDPYPNELAKFVPRLKYDEVILGPAYSTSDATEQVGWIGFYKTYIRVWSMNKGTLQGGTFYGVVDAADKTAEQHEVYTDPLDIQDIDISLLEKTITANGTYSAEDDGYFGYSDVIVNVPTVEGVIIGRTGDDRIVLPYTDSNDDYEYVLKFYNSSYQHNVSILGNSADGYNIQLTEYSNTWYCDGGNNNQLSYTPASTDDFVGHFIFVSNAIDGTMGLSDRDIALFNEGGILLHKFGTKGTSVLATPDIWLLSRSGTGEATNGVIERFTVKDKSNNNAIICDYIPAMVAVDGIKYSGLLNTVNNTFIHNSYKSIISGVAF